MEIVTAAQFLINDKYICFECNKEFSKKGICSHYIKKHINKGKLNHNPNIGFTLGTRKIWNKGLTKETSTIIAKSADTLNSKIQSGEIVPYWLGKKMPPLKPGHNTGGLRKGAGIGKKGWYKNFWCDSSWELAFVIYNLDHNILFERNKQFFEYEFKGIKRKYFPDFKMEDGTFIEIKGYITELVKLKCEIMKNVSYKLFCFPEIEPYLKYVTEKYGDNFIEKYNDD